MAIEALISIHCILAKKQIIHTSDKITVFPKQ